MYPTWSTEISVIAAALASTAGSGCYLLVRLKSAWLTRRVTSVILSDLMIVLHVEMENLNPPLVGLDYHISFTTYAFTV